MYRSLVKIGNKYGLTRDEFDEYCTLSDPRGRKVFYRTQMVRSSRLCRHQQGGRRES